MGAGVKTVPPGVMGRGACCWTGGIGGCMKADDTDGVVAAGVPTGIGSLCWTTVTPPER